MICYHCLRLQLNMNGSRKTFLTLDNLFPHSLDVCFWWKTTLLIALKKSLYWMMIFYWFSLCLNLHQTLIFQEWPKISFKKAWNKTRRVQGFSLWRSKAFSRSKNGPICKWGGTISCLRFEHWSLWCSLHAAVRMELSWSHQWGFWRSSYSTDTSNTLLVYLWWGLWWTWLNFFAIKALRIVLLHNILLLCSVFKISKDWRALTCIFFQCLTASLLEVWLTQRLSDE